MKLVIAEKPSVAQGIAPVIGEKQRQNGYIEGGGYIVSWCYGHLVGQKMPNEYGEEWGSPWKFSQLPMFPKQWQMKINPNAKAQFMLLKKLMSRDDVEEIICATDADREGECIFRYVYMLAGCKKPFRRLWISSLEESAVQKGFASLKDGKAYDNLFSAGFSRAKADWLVGMNGSRLFSLRYHAQLNLGRVQTPTLAMIVGRDSEVENFVKQKYYTVVLDLDAFSASSARIDEQTQAEDFAAKCTGQTANLTSLKKEIKAINPPKLYDLTTLQREANKMFGLTADETLTALQSLYEKMLATYPRTDSQFLSDDMEEIALKMVGIVGQVFDYGTVENPNIGRCINNAKVTGHHAILPTEKIQAVKLDELSQNERNILRMISVKLLMAVSALHKYESVKVTVQCANSDFFTSGKTVVENGWKEIEQRFKTSLKEKQEEEKGDEQALPELQEGQQFENAKAKTAEHWTTPPKYYTEDTLLSAMEHAGQDEYDDETEKKGLGTPATRAGIIEHLVKGAYIERRKKQLISTEKGRKLISIVPEEVKSPKLTADWEMLLQQIERGEYQAAQFMNGIQAYITDLCDKYGKEDEQAAAMFQKPKEVLGKCPHCGAEVQKGKFGIYCAGKCGMFFKLFGQELTEEQVKKLLDGQKITLQTSYGKNVVLPEITEFQLGTKDGTEHTAYQFSVENTPKESQGKCPHCGSAIQNGKFGIYYTGKCGMTFRVYGNDLSEKQFEKLLNGKSLSAMINGKKIEISPEILAFSYTGKDDKEHSGFQFASKRTGKE